MVSKSASLRKFETKRTSRLNGSAIEDAIITRHGMRRGCIVLPYDGCAYTDI